MMRTKFLIVIAVIVAAIMPSVANAGRISIEIGDRPFYRGATYWDRDWEMVWVPGHWSRYRREWVHGHYIRSHRRHHDRDWRSDRRDDRRDDRTYYDDNRR
jgi:hypothetical protein